MHDVHGGRLRIHEPHIDAACTQEERSAAGEQRGPRHATVAAENADIAVSTLVGVARAGPQAGLEQGRGDAEPPWFQPRRAVDVERLHRNLAAMVRPVVGQQPRFEGDECRGVGGAKTWTRRAAGVCIQSAGYIQGHAHAGLGVQPFDPSRVTAFEPALQADAEQSIDNQRPAARRRVRQLGGGGAAGMDEIGMCLARIGGQSGRIIGKGDHHLATGLPQLPRHDETVAAVVARATGKQDRTGAIHGQPHRVLGRCSSGTLHEWRPGGRDQLLLDLPDAGNGIDGWGGQEHWGSPTRDTRF